ncbi:DUF4407 domain-containing protein [Nocardia sp. NPDC003482]
MGIRHDLLDETPVDGFRYVAMASVLLSTAAIASVSAAFALQMALGVPIFWAVLIGLGWGAVILSLDRMLVIGMTRQSGWWRNLLAALPRLALAILIGTVVSTPLVLRIFQPEIVAEMHVQQQQKQIEYNNKINSNQAYQQIPQLQQQLAQETAKANQDPSLIASNDAVTAAQKRVDDATARYDSAKEKAEAEQDGTGGTHVPGCAEACRQDQADEAQALRDLDNAQAERDQAVAQAKATLQQQAPAAASMVAQLRQEIDQLTAAKNDAVNGYASLEKNDNGLLARLEALSALGQDRPALGRAQLLLFLLFLTIEVLPVVVKLLHLSAPPTLYEKLSTDMEKSAARATAKALSRYENVTDFHNEMRMDLEHDLIQRQREAGLRINDTLVTKQTVAAERAVQTFAGQSGQDNDHTAPRLFARLPWLHLSDIRERYAHQRNSVE